MDKHGNINAEEGITLCVCGCKYWENDHCVSCGLLVEIAKIRMLGRDTRYLLAVWSNVQWATTCAYNDDMMGAPITDLTEINERFNVVQGHIYGGF